MCNIEFVIHENMTHDCSDQKVSTPNFWNFDASAWKTKHNATLLNEHFSKSLEKRLTKIWPNRFLGNSNKTIVPDFFSR